jgi:extradiol dioxygenase family protein
MRLRPFHLAVSVHNLVEARAFYGGLLGCPEGRRAEQWIDFDLFGHQLVCHETKTGVAELPTNRVDGEAVPVPHFGVVLDWDDWEMFADRLRSRGVSFMIEPSVRFVGKPGEQATMFFADPSGNMLEFKAMRDPDLLFAV